jgi:DNA-binding winged helix-turn-helix (wHTH) protein
MVHGDRSVDVFVRKLRQKLERVSPRWRYIHTHFGIGYRFAAEPIDEVSEQVPVEVGAGAPPSESAAESPAPEAAPAAVAG